MQRTLAILVIVCCFSGAAFAAEGSESVDLAGGSPLRLTVGVDTGFCNPFLGVTGELLLETGFGLQVDGLVHYNAYGLYVNDKFISSGYGDLNARVGLSYEFFRRRRYESVGTVYSLANGGTVPSYYSLLFGCDLYFLSTGTFSSDSYNSGTGAGVDYDNVEYREFIPATNLYVFPRLSFQWEYDYTDPHAANLFGRHRSLLFDSELGPIFSPDFSEIGLYGEIQLMRAANLIAFAVGAGFIARPDSPDFYSIPDGTQVDDVYSGLIRFNPDKSYALFRVTMGLSTEVFALRGEEE